MSVVDDLIEAQRAENQRLAEGNIAPVKEPAPVPQPQAAPVPLDAGTINQRVLEAGIPGLIQTGPMNTDISLKDRQKEYEVNLAVANETAKPPSLLTGAIDNKLGRSIKDNFMHGANIGVNIGKEVYRKLQNEADPEWTNEATTKWMDDKGLKDVPEDLRWRFFGTRSAKEAEALLQDYDADIYAQRIIAARGGLYGVVSAGIAGLVDIDTPATLFTDGTSLAAKVGIQTTRAGRLLMRTASGAAMGAGLGTIDYQFNPTADAEQIALAALAGGGLGMLGHKLSERGLPDGLHEAPTVQMQRNMTEEVGEQLYHGRADRGSATEPGHDFFPPGPEPVSPLNGQPTPTTRPSQEGGPAPTTFDPREAVEGPTDFGPGSVSTNEFGSTAGARQVNPTHDGPGLDSVEDPKIRKRIQAAQDANRVSGASRDWDDPEMFTTNAVSEAAALKARRFGQGLQGLSIGNDFAKMMNSGLATARMFAVNALESAGGIARGKITAATQKETYQKQLQTIWQGYEDGFRDFYHGEKGFKYLEDIWNPAARQAKNDFDKDVIAELMSRRYGGQGTRSAAAKKAADAADAFWAKELEIGQGVNGQKSVEGYADLKKQSGYVPQSWDGQKMQDMLDRAVKTGGNSAMQKMRKTIELAILEDYKKNYSQIAPDKLTKFAAAVVDRALASRKGLQRSLIGLLDGDEADVVRDALRRQSMDDKEIDRVIDSLKGQRGQAMQPGHTKERMDIDFRSSYNGINMMDLLTTDLQRLAGKRAARTSGLAALARTTGISSKAEYEEFMRTVMAEQAARGKRIQRTDRSTLEKAEDLLDAEPEITPEFLRDLYSYFNATPLDNSTMNPTVQRLKKITQLSLMNQLGLTSLSEHGAIIGQVGLRHWWDHMTTDLKNAWTKSDSPLMQEFKRMSVFVPEDVLFNNAVMQSLEQTGTEQAQLLHKLDKFLNRAQDLQGVLSGFYAVRNSQQRIAIGSVTSKLWEGVKKGEEGFSAARMHDMGFDRELVNRNIKYADFDEEGRLVKLNMDKWSADDVNEFQNVAARVTNQLVQKAMAGESNVFFHKNGLAQIFSQLKSFPLLAFEKQFHRNMRMGDSSAGQTFFWGLVMAAGMYNAKQIINGQFENVGDWKKTAYGAMNYSNMTGWMPMFGDPILSAAGVNWSLTGYQSRDGGPFGSPAALTVANRLWKLPGALAHIAASPLPGRQVSNEDLHTLQTFPLLGNSYFFNGLINQYKT